MNYEINTSDFLMFFSFSYITFTKLLVLNWECSFFLAKTYFAEFLQQSPGADKGLYTSEEWLLIFMPDFLALNTVKSDCHISWLALHTKQNTANSYFKGITKVYLKTVKTL